MTKAKAVGLILFVLLVAAVGVVLVVVAPRWYAAEQPQGRAAAPSEPVATRRIKATLFYVAEDGQHLLAVDREVPYGEGPVEQARRLVEAETTMAPAPLLSAVPAGTTLRGLYVSDQGDAFVDLSRDLVSAHPGGSLNEMLTVYSIVNALTANLPAIHAVQLLVDGREVDTLAGHVDLRRPLTRSAILLATTDQTASQPR